MLYLWAIPLLTHSSVDWFLRGYTKRFNHRHRELGHRFSGRYKALLVDGSGG